MKTILHPNIHLAFYAEVSLIDNTPLLHLTVNLMTIIVFNFSNSSRIFLNMKQFFFSNLEEAMEVIGILILLLLDT